MQTAPFASPLQYANPTPLHLADIEPGNPFAIRNDQQSVYALLTRHETAIDDGSRRWCVVVAAKDSSPRRIGELVPLAAETSVYALTLSQPALYSVS